MTTYDTPTEPMSAEQERQLARYDRAADRVMEAERRARLGDRAEADWLIQSVLRLARLDARMREAWETVAIRLADLLAEEEEVSDEAE